MATTVVVNGEDAIPAESSMVYRLSLYACIDVYTYVRMYIVCVLLGLGDIRKTFDIQ